MNLHIKHIRLTNFRSIADVTLNSIPNFAVFAGSNGSGKSNLFAALDFTSTIIQSNSDAAVRKYGGFDNIHCFRRYGPNAKTFKFDLEALFSEESNNSSLKYSLNINNIDQPLPSLDEELTLIGKKNKKLLSRNGDKLTFFIEERGQPLSFPASFPINQSSLGIQIHGSMSSWGRLYKLLNNIDLFQINPVLSKEPSSSHHDPSQLHTNGDNLARVLQRLERDDSLRERIMEWLNMFVPGLTNIETRHQALDAKTVLLFREQGTKSAFPAHLISDGTVYLLNLLVGIIDRKFPTMTLIEEPERGLHPKAIIDLIPWMREEANKDGPIWLTTHSETVVRQLQDGELWWVEKKNGRTTVTQAPGIPVKGMRRDQAWLSGALDGGLPW